MWKGVPWISGEEKNSNGNKRYPVEQQRMGFQEWNECNVNKDADRCKPIDFWLVPVVFFRQTTQDPCFDYSSLDTQAVESQSGNGSGIVDCHMDTDISDLDIE